ncbi:hypothetical protein BU26DRAFT_515797 [Trematosphaeria pertusa]|uniref:Uncharacterized protein n=1 Tax=Trematosphaeria pertusa TaxID=390896 RepID=A0A6A6IU59_9PLEO|nr:uncharacterized protein BU26DRAFT_515797 [Trematosphaeria pertusa]KAF2253442.1 hypothetical protein BU26DRAFT_515797 [Trematosphaeria pertusa]
MSSRAEGKEHVQYTISPEPVQPPALVGKRISEIDVTEGLRMFVIDDDDELNPTPRPGSPAIVITHPAEPMTIRQRPRQLSSEPTATPRPKLMRNAATAPAGALALYPSIKPQPPRRAISARTARPGGGNGSRHRRSPLIVPPLPRLSQFGTAASRSLISRRKTTRKSVGKLGLKPKNHVWRMSPQSNTKRFQLLSEVLHERRKSLSEKARVKETLKHKKMEMLKTTIVDFKSRDLPGTPSSMMATPREMYGEPETPTPTGPTPMEEIYSGSRRSLLPESPTRPKHFSMPLTPNIERRGTFKHSNSIPHMRGRRKTVYVPGPIRLEEKMVVTPRRGSIATMEPFDAGKEPKAKRFSDMVALDGIVMFFQSLGVVEETSEACLDRFWVPDMRANRPAASPRKGVPPVPARPLIPSFPSSSSALFSSSKKARQDEKQIPPSPGTPGRQKVRLRQLLKSSRSIL